MTEPGFMSLIISRVTSRGALAPGMSTAPTRTSARLTHSSMLMGLDMRVVTFAGAGEVVGGDGDRHPAGDLAHRFQQRFAAIVCFHRFVGDPHDLSLEEAAGQFELGGEMEEGKENLAGPEIRVLARLRLLHLADHFGPGVEVVPRAAE